MTAPDSVPTVREGCPHEWSDRGSPGDEWRECWLCGTVAEPCISIGGQGCCDEPTSTVREAGACECPPCPGRGNDGHAMTHCAECCFGSGVDADIDCPIHGDGKREAGDEGIAAVLAGHRRVARLGCRCGVYFKASAMDDAAILREHAAHLADALAPLIAERERAAAERALREAANAWTQGQWSDVMLPKPTPPAVPVIAYSNRMGDWLRDRADRIGGDDD